jgi:hypothetical protein
MARGDGGGGGLADQLQWNRGHAIPLTTLLVTSHTVPKGLTYVKPSSYRSDQNESDICFNFLNFVFEFLKQNHRFFAASY